MGDYVLLPWAEANQGALSLVQGSIALVALTIALLAFFSERNQERRAAERRLRDYIDFVLLLLDSLLAAGDRALAAYAAHPGAETLVAPTHDWLRLRPATAAALVSISSAPPPDPRLAFEVATVLTALGTASPCHFLTGRPPRPFCGISCRRS